MNKLRLKHLRSKVIKIITLVDRKGNVRRVLSKIIPKIPIKPEEQLDSAEPLNFLWPANIPKPMVGLVQERIHRYASWPKYERFLKHNQIPYQIFDVHRSDFITQAKQFDLIIWHTRSSFAEQWEAKSKIEFLEKKQITYCFPSSEALWFYEDKIRQQWLLDKHNIRAVNSFISFSKQETIQYLDECTYPIVSKEATNSGSEGVILLKNKKQALRFCDQVFGSGHKVHSATYLRQKDYVLFQDFIPNEGYDLRIIIIGNHFFGYYRNAPKGEFRASGSGIVIKKDIPHEAMLFARSIQELFPPSHYLSVDLLKNTTDNQYYVIEVSLFNRIETSQQMIVNGTPGRYSFEDNQFKFYPGRVWVQELTLCELFKTWIENNKASA
jgi:glutathione synthase/RimK-type ligase-like ATP-grasp enzyme